jgi:hypothetical protein
MAADDPQSPRVEDAPPPRKRRRWQFSLSTLLLIVTASAVVSWWYARQEPWEEFQQRFTERVKNLGGEIEWGSGQSPTRLSFRYWGFSDSTPLTDDKLRALRRDLGRLGPFTLNLSGSQNARGAITDAGLEHLDGLLRLECLCLRHTDVTDAGLEHLTRLKGLQLVDLRDTKAGGNAVRGARPDLVVYSSDWLPNSPSKSSLDWKAPELMYIAEESVGGVAVAYASLQFESRRTSKKREVSLSHRDLLIHDLEARSFFISASDVLVSLHGPISDSGVQLVRIDLTRSPPRGVWEVFAEPLGVDHSKYRHDAHVFVHGDRCVVVSDGSATFVEIRDLATGELLKRWVY